MPVKPTKTGKETAVSHDAIKNNIKVCMFDQYGTVVDMQSGLTAIAVPFLKQKGWSGSFWLAKFSPS